MNLTQLLHPTAPATGPSSATTTPPRRLRGGRLLVLAPFLPVLLVGLAVATFGLGGTLTILGVVALGLITFGLTALGGLAVVLRRRLGELRHLPDLGRGFVTHHDDARVTGVTRAADGDVVLEVAALSRQTTVLDEAGTPDEVRPAPAGTSSWRLRGSAHMSPEDLARLALLQSGQVPVTIVAKGVVALTGPVTSGWRLTAADGTVVESRA